MTLSAEERAREVVRSLHEPLDAGKPYLETPMRKLMTEVIAQAIRDACNEKLEEAARAMERSADRFVAEAGSTDYDGDVNQLRQLAGLTRSLKDTTP